MQKNNSGTPPVYVRKVTDKDGDIMKYMPIFIKKENPDGTFIWDSYTESWYPVKELYRIEPVNQDTKVSDDIPY